MHSLLSKQWFLFVCLCAIICACKQKEPLFQLLPASQTGITFNNEINENDSINVIDFDYIYNGAGVGVGDFNNDGLIDLFFSGNQVPCKLYLNQGNFSFIDVTKLANINTPYWSTGVSLVDINQDGLLDIYLSTIHPNPRKSSPNQLFINQGINNDNVPTFIEVASEAGLDDRGYSTQAAFLDYDRDGDLDVYLLNNALEGYNRSTPRRQLTDGSGRSTDRLLRNDSVSANGTPIFTDVSNMAGITLEGWGLGICVSDINNDGWQDIYCANDFISSDHLWINNHNGTFTDKIGVYSKHQSANSMGIDIADINNDGLNEIISVDMMPEDNLRQKMMFTKPNYESYQLLLQQGYQPQFVRNALQLNQGEDNNGNLVFSEIAQLSNVYATDWSWSALFADFDNDGYKDLFISNGYKKDVTNLDFVNYDGQNDYSFGQNVEETKLQRLEKMEKLIGVKKSNVMYRNKGDLTFDEVTQDWGLKLPSYSNGAVYADLDNDGDLDIVTNNINDPAFMYRNNLINEEIDKPHRGKNFIRISLKGPSGNISAIGSKIKVYYQGKFQSGELSPYRGYKSSVEPVVHFGLGNTQRIDSLLIFWPDGKLSMIENSKVNQTLTVSYQNISKIDYEYPSGRSQTLFSSANYMLDSGYIHQENSFVDFKNQILLPHMYSRSGPGLAVGDIDGNGLDDFFVGASAFYPNRIYKQVKPGKFVSNELSRAGKSHEDTGALLVDVDNDDDLDLYVVSGGSEFNPNSESYQDRLYRNHGKGKIVEDTLALPNTTASGSCVVAADYDKDGDVDIFVGGRIIPGSYPLPAQSYLLQNKKGTFTDVTNQVNDGLQNIGLVTSALWTDYNNDTWIDLIVVGEFMSITIFKNENGKLVNETKNAGLDKTSGWWNSINGGDFDKDGDTDYIVGNHGLNSRYKVSDDEPLCVYAKDYDNNGSIDPIMCAYIQGKNYPVHPRDQLAEQVPGLKKRFTSFQQYGLMTFDKILRQDELQNAYVARATIFTSSYLENKGNGTFTISPLPIKTQIAPIFGIVCQDFNHDGKLDALLTGNQYSTDIQTGRYDAFAGQLLLGNGNGTFTPLAIGKAGLIVKNDAKALATISTGDQFLVLATQNSDSLKVFASNKITTDRIFKAGHDDTYAVMEFENGKKQKIEFYNGAGYLSQSSKSIPIGSDCKRMVVYSSYDKVRVIDFKK